MFINRLFFTICIGSLSAINGRSTNNTCTILQEVNGCSTPFRLDIPHRLQFTPACNKHDVCYRCGKNYNWTQLDCDNGFKKEMYQICNSSATNAPQSFLSWKWSQDLKALYEHIYDVWKKITISRTTKEEAKRLWEGALIIYNLTLKWNGQSDHLLKCYYAADIYNEAVRYFGVYAYRMTTKPYCSEQCVIAAGRPI